MVGSTSSKEYGKREYMSALARLEERIEALEEAAEAIKEETRLAHEATKRLREARKEVKYLLENEVKDMVNEAVAEHVAKGLESYTKTIEEQTEIATQKVFKRFDDLFNILATGKKSGDGAIVGTNRKLKK